MSSRLQYPTRNRPTRASAARSKSRVRGNGNRSGVSGGVGASSSPSPRGKRDRSASPRRTPASRPSSPPPSPRSRAPKPRLLQRKNGMIFDSPQLKRAKVASTSTDQPVRVLVRKRNGVTGSPDCLHVSDDGTSITTQRPSATDTSAEETTFHYARVLDCGTPQQQVYEEAGAPVVEDLLQGKCATIMAYGNTGSGKTWSIQGSDEDPGVQPRMVQAVFRALEQGKAGQGPLADFTWTIKLAYFEIYNEEYRDLLARRTRNKVTSVAHVKHQCVSNESDVLAYLAAGQANRSQAETKMNTDSSRSHSIMRLELSGYPSDLASLSKAKRAAVTRSMHLNVVDLAGTERGHGRRDQRELSEAKGINQSLMTLRRVMTALHTRSKNRGRGPLPPYRESKLTLYLKDTFAGGSATMLCCVSPDPERARMTWPVLEFGAMSQEVCTRAVVRDGVEEAAAALRAEELERQEREAREERERQEREAREERERQEREERKRVQREERARQAEQTRALRQRQREATERTRVLQATLRGKGQSVAQQAAAIGQARIHGIPVREGAAVCREYTSLAPESMDTSFHHDACLSSSLLTESSEETDSIVSRPASPASGVRRPRQLRPNGTPAARAAQSRRLRLLAQSPNPRASVGGDYMDDSAAEEDEEEEVEAGDDSEDDSSGTTAADLLSAQVNAWQSELLQQESQRMQAMMEQLVHTHDAQIAAIRKASETRLHRLMRALVGMQRKVVTLQQHNTQLRQALVKAVSRDPTEALEQQRAQSDWHAVLKEASPRSLGPVAHLAHGSPVVVPAKTIAVRRSPHRGRSPLPAAARSPLVTRKRHDYALGATKRSSFGDTAAHGSPFASRKRGRQERTHVNGENVVPL